MTNDAGWLKRQERAVARDIRIREITENMTRALTELCNHFQAPATLPQITPEVRERLAYTVTGFINQAVKDFASGDGVYIPSVGKAAVDAVLAELNIRVGDL